VNLVADENVDRQVVEILRSDGHSVTTAYELAPGLDDTAILDLARSTSTILLTADKDFGELVYRRGEAFFGVILLRLPGMTPGDRAALVSQVLIAHAAEFAGSFTVITKTSTRVRRRI
jgi:predicted nuclease of predicted toxin-antitoxin system